MFIGPVFTREAITAPRRPQFFVARVVLVAVLLGLALTAWQVFVGAGGGDANLSGPSELARFGQTLFGLLTPLVLTVAMLFSALLCAAAVSQEKSRGTLVLLLLTDLRNSELVVGRLLASLLTVLVATLAAAPLLMLVALLGGVSHAQIAEALAVIAAASLAAGSLGSTLALWREKPFQALALTAIGLVLWLAVGEVIASGAVSTASLGIGVPSEVAAAVSPWRALGAAMAPRWGPPPALLGVATTESTGRIAPAAFVAFGLGLTALLNLAAIALVRVWNPSREVRIGAKPAATSAAVEGEAQADASETAEPAPVVGRARGQEQSVHRATGRRRRVWDNPVLWREVRTWAYGRKVLVVKAAYLVIFAVLALATIRDAQPGQSARQSEVPAAATAMAPLLVVSLVLVNALSVTSLTGERDGKSLDLLLATDLSPRELIFGKLGGALWNAREMILLPTALAVWLAATGSMTGWQLAVFLGSLAVMTLFAAVVGLHSAMIYVSSRKAIAVSVGTLLFLFLGVSTCMRMMLALSDTFDGQLASFIGFIVGGGLALFVTLGWRNPAPAMALASFAAPFAMFYAIVSFLLGSYSLVGVATIVTFGFATAAMLVPALSEFDIATGAQPTRRD